MLMKVNQGTNLAIGPGLRVEVKSDEFITISAGSGRGFGFRPVPFLVGVMLGLGIVAGLYYLARAVASQDVATANADRPVAGMAMPYDTRPTESVIVRPPEPPAQSAAPAGNPFGLD